MQAALNQEPEALALASEAETLQQLVHELKGTTLETHEQAEQLNELVKEVKRDLKQLETDRESTTRSTFERLEAMRAWFRPKQAALKELERVGKLKLAEYALRVTQAQTVAQTAAGQAFARGDSHAGHALLGTMPETVSLPGTSMRPVFTFVITDPNLLPTEFWCPNLEKIQSYLDTMNGAPIPGVTVTRGASVTTRI